MCMNRGGRLAESSALITITITIITITNTQENRFSFFLNDVLTRVHVLVCYREAMLYESIDKYGKRFIQNV